MKDQLAKMTIIELVRTAHSYSTSIKQTGVYSELVREMASRLEALNLAHIGAMAALETTAKRIASLEARTLTAGAGVMNIGNPYCDDHLVTWTASGRALLPGIYRIDATFVGDHKLQIEGE